VSDQQSPEPAAVRALREAVQAARALGITAAQDYCAERLMVKRRTWQSWELGERDMPPIIWWAAGKRIGTT
jgi:hypothetical protein